MMFQRQQQSWSIILVIVTMLMETTATKTRQNLFDPILSSDAYIGHIQENELLVRLEPHLYASDADPPNSPNGKICGYELSLHRHDDTNTEASENIPFIVEINNEQAVIKKKSNVNKLDCEIKQNYHLFIRAYDCPSDNTRRYSERSSLIITIDDVNEYAPVFTHTNYLFKLHQDQTCSSCRVEATDDDCGNIDHGVCGYQITTPNTPFSIDSNGSISIKKSLIDDIYDFNVVAIDCYPSSTNDNKRKTSEPAKVTIKVIKSCKPTITNNNPTKLTIHSDHSHIFDTVHVDTCDETCAVEDISGIVTLDTNGIDSGCKLEECSSINREYILIPKDVDYNQAPTSRVMSFNGISQDSIVEKAGFSGQFNNDFTIRLWMKHANSENDEKEQIFCKSDENFKNRHHMGLFIQDDYLKLLIRKGPISSEINTVFASEWMWKLTQINDDQWHSYKLFVNYPNKIDLYIDDQLFVATNDTFHITESFPLTVIEETKDTVFTLGACWHARASRMVQHFNGQLSGLTIEQEELPSKGSCIRDCRQYLDILDVQSQSDIIFTSNSDRSIWTLRTDSSESFEELLKHIVYFNTFEPLGPPGQRTVTIQTSIKCLGENYTYNLPLFTRRLSIDEIIPSTIIELKGDTNFFIKKEILNRGINLFQNLSIHTDDMKKDQVDIKDCSINTSPDLFDDEQLIVPNDYLQINNLQKDLTQTGLVISGISSIDSYQHILRQIIYKSKSSVNNIDRSFSLVCGGVHDQISTNEIHIQIHVEKQVSLPAPMAAILSNELKVDNDQIRDNLLDVERSFRLSSNSISWPLAVVVCVSVGLAGVLVLYIVVRIRSGNRQRSPLTGTGDDMHSQMEWEDDIGLNIIVNPLDETKKPVQSINPHPMEQIMDEYEGTSSEEDDEYDGHSHNEYSSEEDDDEDQEHNEIHSRKQDHQLEWDDESMEYGPKKV